MSNITPTTYVATRLFAACLGKYPSCEVLRCGTLRIARWHRNFVFTLLVLFGSHPAADEPSPVETMLVAEVQETLETGDGRSTQRFLPATVLNQGQVVFYTVKIRNPTTAPVRDVVVTQRIPANTTYVPSSAAGPSAEITFSVDGGQSFWPEKQLVVATSATEARKAIPEDYTHIRWQLRNALAPGAVALARFQAVFR
jgi:uncharacterized repeat protein (TIGR01451 family)